jgi:hypothetical protein
MATPQGWLDGTFSWTDLTSVGDGWDFPTVFPGGPTP